MKRIITVKGTGHVTAAPDKVELKMEIETLQKEYKDCQEISDKRYDIVHSALLKSGFSPQDIKTADFRIEQEYHYGNRDYVKVLDGWKCIHSLKVEFPLDIQRLKNVLNRVISCGAELEFTLDFTVSDANALQESLLADAAKNARKKAEVLCSASGVKLGELLSINYSWGEINIYSRSKYDGRIGCCVDPCATEATIEPDDIDVSDTATFVWAIE